MVNEKAVNGRKKSTSASEPHAPPRHVAVNAQDVEVGPTRESWKTKRGSMPKMVISSI